VHKQPRAARVRALAGFALVIACLVPGSMKSSAASGAVDATGIGSKGATATALAQRIAAPTPPASPGPSTDHFVTLPVGSALPSDAACAAAVRPAAELRADNAQANHTVGVGATDGQPRVTGNYVGSTDEIIQWTACKWGIDEDIVRAQIAKESGWHQNAKGDLTSDQSSCYPALRTGSGSCPESVGLGQVRFPYHGAAFANGNAVNSSAYNLDYTYAQWRSCFEGQQTWLNNAERGAQYAAGDQWGCVGLWFAGRWYTNDAKTYIATVKDYLAQRVWETPGFKTW
jgi:hypothetical protein